MKYLFFDLECSNCYGGIGKVCEFGAILTDDKFNIISKFDIPMSPGKKSGGFDKSIYKRDPDFDWAYSWDYYYRCNEFPKFYQRIKELLEDGDTKVFGYAVDNDIRYLSQTCERYDLEPIQFDVYDVRLIKKDYKKGKQEIRGLKGACLELCDFMEILSLTPHLARDDAKMTMMVLRAICNNLYVSIEDIIELCPNSKLNSKEYMEGYLYRKEDKILHPEKYVRKSKTHPKDECQVAWGEFYRQYDDSVKNNNVVTISSRLKEDMSILNSVIDTIKQKEYIASDKINNSNYLIVLDEDDKKRMENIFKYPYNGTIVLLNEFIRV